MQNTLVSKISRLILISSALAFTVPASAYTLMDDPSSYPNLSNSIATINGNIVTYTGGIAQNATGNYLPQLNLLIPFIYPYISSTSTYLPIEWSNTVGGWYSSNFNNTGTSLTVQLTSASVDGVKAPISYVPMGNIEDGTGTGVQFPLAQPCQASVASCYSAPAGASLLSENLKLTDAVPIFSLGAFAPNQGKALVYSFTYTYGNGIGNALDTGGIAVTLSAAPVPLPTSVWLFGTAIACFVGLQRRNPMQAKNLS